MYNKNTYEWHKMNHALLAMKSCSSKQQRVTSRFFELYRQRFSQVMSVSQTGTNNSQYGKKWMFSISERKNKKVLLNEIEQHKQEGFQEGRIVDFDKVDINGLFIKQECLWCGELIKADKQYSNKKYCNNECRTESRKNQSMLLNRKDEFINFYKEFKNMNKALKSMGLCGAVGDYYYWAKEILNSL